MAETLCLRCRKRPARLLAPGRAAVFCSAACKTAWSKSQDKWATRYAKACDKADRMAPTGQRMLF